ncbi:DUF3180 family protein [Microbacterium sp.]|uniref:DUF3180 family protein n=1 Tax=Microbacterium sp. TaxID=51671 RepID=UPI0039E49D63
MRRTSAALLATVAAAGAVVGYAIDQLLTSTGRPTFTPSVMLPVLLVLLGAFTVMLALPIRRATRGVRGRPVDPFRALRVAMLAKACSIVGAAVGGAAAGMAAFLATRPVAPSLGSMGAVIATVVAAAALVVAGLIAEHLCTIRKDDDDGQSGPGDPGAELAPPG